MVYMQFILKFRCILKTFGVFFIEFILKFYFRINFEFQKYIYYGMEIVYYMTHIYTSRHGSPPPHKGRHRPTTTTHELGPRFRLFKGKPQRNEWLHDCLLDSISSGWAFRVSRDEEGSLIQCPINQHATPSSFEQPCVQWSDAIHPLRISDTKGLLGTMPFPSCELSRRSRPTDSVKSRCGSRRCRRRFLSTRWPGGWLCAVLYCTLAIWDTRL